MEATVAERGARKAKGGAVAAAQGEPHASSAELRLILDEVLQAIDGDERAGALFRAAGPRLRLELTDREVILNIAPGERSGGGLRWRFDDELDSKPRLRMWMDAATANRYLQGRESLAIAIARGRVRCEGDARAALLYLPAMRSLIEPYRRLVRERYPDLAID